jgi:hypothetical protein
VIDWTFLKQHCKLTNTLMGSVPAECRMTP